MDERDYGTAPIQKLFFRCTVPAMVGMGFSVIYNITDGILSAATAIIIVKSIKIQ